MELWAGNDRLFMAQLANFIRRNKEANKAKEQTKLQEENKEVSEM